MWVEVVIVCLYFYVEGRGVGGGVDHVLIYFYVEGRGVEGGVDHVFMFLRRGAWCGRRC